MSPSPDDGDTYEAPPKLRVPDDVRDAVRTLIRWAGDDPDREGLLETPERVARARPRGRSVAGPRMGGIFEGI